MIRMIRIIAIGFFHNVNITLACIKAYSSTLLEYSISSCTKPCMKHITTYSTSMKTLKTQSQSNEKADYL